MEIESLYNKGIKFIGDESAVKSEHKTFIVMGVARGGTSLIASSLAQLGVFMGEHANDPVYEDVKLAELIEKNRFNEAVELISKYNSQHKVWGFKRPSLINKAAQYHAVFRNPVYLIIFKDIFAVANRKSISMGVDINDGLSNAQADYQKVVDFINNHSMNAYLFSYEKVMNDRELYVDSLVDIIGLSEITAGEKNELLKYITPNPQNYIQQSRLKKPLGHVDVVSREMVKGWAKFSDSDDAVDVQICVNNEVVLEMTADIFRKGLFESGRHSTGNAGFQCSLEGLDIPDNAIIDVKVKGDFALLKGSGKTL